MRRTCGRAKALPGTLAALLSVTVLASAGPVGAAEQELIHVGRAAAVVSDVQGRIGDQAPKRITVDERLFYEQRIITTNNSRSVVEFRDGSELQIGPNAVVSLDRFVFNPFESKSEKVITSVSGAFRYISGMKTKTSSIEIRTPTATIGIRGSLATWLVHPNLPTFFSLQHGLATVQTQAGRAEVNPGQSVAVVSRTSPPSPPAPAPIAAQVLNHINNALGNLTGGGTTQSANDARTDSAANTTPTQQQQSQQRGPLSPLTVPTNIPPLTDVPLLQQATRLGLFTHQPGQPFTPAQQQFLNQANQQFPNALQQIQAAVQRANQQTSNNANRSTTLVIGGIAQFTPNKTTLAGLLANVASADPDHVGAAVAAAIKFAPGQALAIATAAARAVPGRAADIAGAAAGANPNLAAAFAAALGAINPGAITQIAQATGRAAPGQATAILNALDGLPNTDRGTLIAALSSGLPQQQAAQLLANVAPAAGDTAPADSGGGGSAGAPTAGGGTTGDATGGTTTTTTGTGGGGTAENPSQTGTQENLQQTASTS